GIVKQHQPDAILDSDCAPGNKRRCFDRRDGLHGALAAEEHPQSLIDHHQYRTFSLFCVNPALGLACAGGDLPIDLTNVIARQVATDFCEIQTASTKL